MMKRTYFVLTGLLVLLVILQLACVPVTPTAPGETPPTEQNQQPTEGSVTTEPSGEQLPFPLTPVDKPSLLITDEQNTFAGQGISVAHAVGFTFPDGLVAIKATAVNKPESAGNDLTTVGVVEIGPDAQKIASGTYLVAIDLMKDDATVNGRVSAIQKEGPTYDLSFERTVLIRNPARGDSPSFPSISPIISSTGVCFAVGISEQPGVVANASGNAKFWYRYCSLAATSGDFILSVANNFPVQFGDLRNRVEETIARVSQAFPQNVNINFDLAISEMEGHTNIDACNKNNDCASDISGAPNANFWQDYDQAKDAAGGNNFAVTIGIVRVERPLDVPGQQIVQPGDYWIRDWFDAQENYLGATLLGVTTENIPVFGQTIPSTPAYFLDADNPRNVVSWISAWKLCNWCKWQSNCP